MPLPFGTLKGGEEYGFRDRLRYRLTETELAGSSRLARHVRSFEFHAGGFVCRDRIAFRRRCEFAEFTPANFLFRTLRHSSGAGLQTWHRAASANLRLRPAGAIHRHAALTASGPLVAENGGLVLYRGEEWKEVVERHADPVVAVRIEE